MSAGHRVGRALAGAIGQDGSPVTAGTGRRHFLGQGLVLAALPWLAMPPAARAQAEAGAGWPLWQHFAETFVQADGRVVDFSVPQMHSTSEGQSYGMFFALVAGDQARFEAIWNWSVANLFEGGVDERLPAWQWGRREDGTWGILDPNSASDADLWFAYALLEAARLWRRPALRKPAEQLLANVRKKEVATLPGLGEMLLPGPTGFAYPEQGVWRLNPSYLMLPQLRRLAGADPTGPWRGIANNSMTLLRQCCRQGFIADWVAYQASAPDAGMFILDPYKGDLGSYDAIRCYMWAGMTSPRDPFFQEALDALGGMRRVLASREWPPEQVRALTGEVSGDGPVGFSAALLPYLRAFKDEPAYQRQWQRVQQQIPQADGTPANFPPYYDMVLALFALGWVDQRYHFSADGTLVLARK